MTTADAELLDLWKRRAHPFQPAQLESQPSWFVTRPGRSVQDLVTDFTDPLTSQPGRWPHWVLVGNRGSGKTFHLHQFAQRLHESGAWFPVFLDLERTFELQSLRTGAIDELQPWELVLLAAAAVVRAVPSWHVDPDHAAALAAIERAARALLPSSEVPTLDLRKLAAGVVGLLVQHGTGLPVAGVLQATLTSPEPWNVPLARREHAVGEDDPRARTLLEAVDDLLRRVSATLGRQVVLVLDGVDRASTDDESTTRRLLVSDTSLARLDCPVICTAGPIWYRFHHAPECRLRWSTEMLDNVTVARRTAPWKPEPGGTLFFRELCDRRLAASNEQVDDVFEAEALALLAFYSGGVAREFVRMVQSSMSLALRLGDRRIGYGHAMQVVARAGSELDPGWTAQDTAIVEAVRARPHEMPDLPGLARAVTQQLIRPYRNGVFWWGLNPLLYRHKFRPPDGEAPPG